MAFTREGETARDLAKSKGGAIMECFNHPEQGLLDTSTCHCKSPASDLLGRIAHRLGDQLNWLSLQRVSIVPPLSLSLSSIPSEHVLTQSVWSSGRGSSLGSVDNSQFHDKIALGMPL